MGEEAAAVAAVQSADPVDAVLMLVRQRGGRVTPARRLLLDAMITSPGHHTAQELAEAVRTLLPGLPLSTIYRNLDELSRMHVVDCTYAGHGPATYHLASAPHGHLACEHCGAIAELPGDVFLSLAEAAMTAHSFEITPARFAIPGLCAGCRDDR